MQVNFDHLSDHPTVAELPDYDVVVPQSTPTREIAHRFDEQPDLPGVIVDHLGDIVGVLSRERLRKELSQPFGLEIYMRRPVQVLLDAIQMMPLITPASCGIAEATNLALSRPTLAVHEPIVVDHGQRRFSLLDDHVLLLAQSFLLTRANQLIQSQKAAAEAANVAKSQFLANMSHEIRTPLTAILGFAENLLDVGLAPDERTAALQTILRNGEHLLEVINEILDLSKIEAGRIGLHFSRFSPAQLAVDVTSIMRVRSAAKNLGLQLEFLTPLPDTIYSDPTRLRQVLINLLGNAIKFTERGSVSLRVSLDIPADEPTRTCFEIVDTGIGISEEQLGRLFQPFSQADGSTFSNYGGTGLGLSISRRLAKMLGGNVVVTSQVGVGSRFLATVETGDLAGVPLERPRLESLASPVPQSAAPDLAKLDCRILLAEDSPDNQLLIGNLLRKLGANVEVVHNGQQAVETAAAALSPDCAFDVILMDIQMPTLDGHGAMRLLREQGYDRPIIALTANAMAGEESKCLSAGFDDYATKPINRRRLVAQIAEQIRRQPESAELPPARLESASPAPGEPTPAHSVADEQYDYSIALSRAGGDEQLARELCGMVRDLARRQFDQLGGAVAARDATASRRQAHTLKNSADNIGAHAVRDMAHRIEQLAAADSLAEIPGLMDDLDSAVSQLIAALAD